MEQYFFNLLFKLISSVGIVFFILYCFFLSYYKYWEKRNFPYLVPRFPLGNSQSLFCKFPGPNLEFTDHYREIKKKGYKFAGVFATIRPILVIADTEIVKDILVKDFDHFVDRGFYKTASDPLSVTLFSMDAVEWRKTRIRLTPTFTSGKLKMMFPLIICVSASMIEEIDDLAKENSDIDIKKIATNFTINTLAICALGIEPGKSESSYILSEMAQKHFDVHTPIDLLKYSLMNRFPDFSSILGLKLLKKEVSEFFITVVRDAMKYREEMKLFRPDLLELLMNIKNETKSSPNPLTDNQLIAEIFDFFLASLDTSSATISFTLFELGKNPDIQEKVRLEIEGISNKHNGKLNTDSLAEMKYLHQIINESLRLYPPLPTLERKCTKSYKINGTDLIIEKGTSIVIPVFGIHRDPEHYPDPKKFDPERFSDSNKGNIKANTYLPFGIGPRSCIGLRFGYLMVQIALIEILRRYRIAVSPSTCLPMDMDKQVLMLLLKNPILLKATKI
nr:cytochrome P450 6a2-like [Leptinotarsa decemlineata]